MFSKDLLFVPICYDVHWSLGVVVNPRLIPELCTTGKISEGETAWPTILYLDSMGNTSKTGKKFASLMQEYLFNEYLHRKLGLLQGADEETGKALWEEFKKIHRSNVKVPIQPNEYDCGFYLVRNTTMLLENHDSIIDKVASNKPISLYEEYNEASALELRIELQEKVEGFKKANKENKALTTTAAPSRRAVMLDKTIQKYP